MKTEFIIGIVVIVILAALGVWYFFFYKKSGSGGYSRPDKMNPVIIPFRGSSLSAFAEGNRVTLSKLCKLNPDLLQGYTKLTEVQRHEIVKRLQGKELIIRYKQTKQEFLSRGEFKSNLSGENTESDYPPPYESGSDFQKEAKPILNDNEIVTRIKALESVVEKIRLNNVKLDSVVSSFVEKENLIAEINNLKSGLDDSKREKLKLENQLGLLSGKVVLTDFLDNYTAKADAFFSTVRSGYGKALELYNKIQVSDEKSSLIVAQLLMKYNQNIPADAGIWEAVVQEMISNRATSHPVIISTFRQIQTEEEKLREFKRILNKNVLEKYASNMLILAGELAVLSSFTGNYSPSVKEFEQFFDDYAKLLSSRVTNTGLEFKPVPLFKNYEGFAGLTQQISQDCSLPYRHIKDIERNSILEIISIGFGGEKTKIILA
jgi:hypothetical protein